MSILIGIVVFIVGCTFGTLMCSLLHANAVKDRDDLEQEEYIKTINRKKYK